MRTSHKPAPFHRIECWNGSYFRPASLWEVGSYILVQHHDEGHLCDTLVFQTNFLDSQQIREDDDEQQNLRKEKTTGPESAPTQGPDILHNLDEDIIMDCNDDASADAKFEAHLDSWLNNSSSENILEEDFDSDDAGTDIMNVVEYLGPIKESNKGKQKDPGADINPAVPPDPDPVPASDHTRPKTDGLNNAYVRVLHTNGIHHIGMVSCSCRGHDKIPLDLMACRLLPTSFIRIRTIFSAQLMDYFRLCNLELKASAYQFYQLIRRLTLPLGQSEMINLYHEFRRMSRLWRWMKKLKWAGYGHNQDDYLNPPPGSLSIFCPTCPQPSVNLPQDWKLDKNR